MPPLIEDQLYESASSRSLDVQDKATPIVVAAKTTTASIPQTPTTRKHVRFCNQAFVYDHIHRNDISINEKRSTWYNKRELKSIKRETERVVRWMIERIPSSSNPHHSQDGHIRSITTKDEVCCRGLEHRTLTGSMIRRRQRLNAADAILDYQSYCWEAGLTPLPENLAKVYKRFSEHAAKVALIVAQMDEANSCESNLVDDTSSISSDSSSSSSTSFSSYLLPSNAPSATPYTTRPDPPAMSSHHFTSDETVQQQNNKENEASAGRTSKAAASY